MFTPVQFLGACAAAAYLLVFSLWAQERVRVDVELVNIAATVTDAEGRPVQNLSIDDFIVEDDGVPQKISHFSQDRNVPVSIGIVLDTSASMEPRLKAAAEAVMRFARELHADDDIFLMTFAARPVLRVDFTRDRQKISSALRAIPFTGSEFNLLEVVSAIYDSLSAALRKVHTGRHEKRMILFITDGRDTWSRATADEITQTIRRSEVLVYSLGIAAGDPRHAVNMDVLREFADSSGGRATLLRETEAMNKSAELDRVFSELAEELRNQYSLGYYPLHPNDGRFHAIRVKTRNGENVRARSGYVAKAR